jgi:hypothetical protein
LATVITNLLSAIPIFGQDIVELIFNFVRVPCLSKALLSIFGNVDFILKNTVITVLPTIGTVSTQAIKKGKQLRLDKNEYLSIPYQFISFLVGLIDGDGYIQITKTTKGFITIKLVIGLGLDDLSTLEYIHSVLKLGKITIYRDHRNPICKLIINKTDLQEVVFPLLIHHNIFFLTNTRRDQFDLAIHIFKNNLKSFENIPNINNIFSAGLPTASTPAATKAPPLREASPLPRGSAPPLREAVHPPLAARLRKQGTIFNLPETASDYLKLEFFRN